MELAFATKGKEKGDVHYVNVPVSYAVDENFGGYSVDFDVLAFAEDDLELQDCVLQSLQNNTQNGTDRASSSSGSRSHVSHDSIGESSSFVDTRFDEYLARQLQEELKLDATANAFDAGSTVAIDNTTPTLSATADNRRTTTRTSQVRLDHGVDPDNMSYEELERLGETIGTESKGLSKDVISLLSQQRYKTGLFSKREKLECPICYEEYKKRETVMTLPCKHHYHKKCITTWLRCNKTCPICKEEVFGS